MELALVKKYLPEYKQVLAAERNVKPRKFIGKINIVKCPATFNPSAQGDFAYTALYSYDGKNLTRGPGWSYDTMMSGGVNPYEHAVDVPKGIRVWVVTYDGQWGGYWARVNVYVHQDEIPAPLALPSEALALPAETVRKIKLGEGEVFGPELSLTDYDKLYTFNELREMCRERGIHSSGDKKALISKLLSQETWDLDEIKSKIQALPPDQRQDILTKYPGLAME